MVFRRIFLHKKMLMKLSFLLVLETLRLHPPFPVTSRMCTQTYKIPDTDVIIEEGTTLLFSAIGLQYDSKYYEQPDKFVPERYSGSHASKSFVEMPNLVFGEG